MRADAELIAHGPVAPEIGWVRLPRLRAVLSAHGAGGDEQIGQLRPVGDPVAPYRGAGLTSMRIDGSAEQQAARGGKR